MRDAVRRKKTDGLIERKSSFFDEVQRSNREREFENRLHGWMRVRVEVEFNVVPGSEHATETLPWASAAMP